MKIKDIMTYDAYTVSPETSVSEVANLLFSHRFHGIPVVENKKIVGIITEDDFFLKNYDGLFLPSYMKFLEEHKNIKNLPEEIQGKIRKLLKLKAKDIMTAGCKTVSPEMDAEELMSLIKETKFTTFPVTDSQENCIGIVTLSDILGTVKKGSDEMGRLIERENNKSKLYKLTTEINDLWKDKVVVVSKKQVRTWKGGTIIALAAIILVSISVIAMTDSQSACSLEDKDLLPTECQKFTYSDWQPCNAEGLQKRIVTSKLPKGCEGGKPVVTQKCQ